MRHESLPKQSLLLRRAALAAATAALLVTTALATAAETSSPWDGLVKIKSSRLDTVQLLPGADFRGYTKVMIDPAQVAFKKDWLQNMNDVRGAAQRITNDEAERIALSMRSGFEDLFAAAFRHAGYEVTSVTGPDVLRLSPAVNDIYINAPDSLSNAGSKIYTVEAGEATLVVEARDSLTGALLGRAVDRRDARAFGPVTLTNNVTNVSDFRQLFRRWADICVKGLMELKQRSPLTETAAAR